MKYQLRMTVDIQQCDDRGYGVTSSGRLNVTEEVVFAAASFLEIAHVLGQFHELSEKIKDTSAPAGE